MVAADRTLKELAAPNVNQQPLCITYPVLEVAFELKSGLLHLLPSFYGFAGEDPHKHLKNSMWCVQALDLKESLKNILI